MSTRFRFIALILLLCITAVLNGKIGGKYSVGVNNQFPPYEFINDKGKIVGSNIDILKAVAKDTGYGFKFVCDDWGIIRDKFDKQEVQLVAGMIKTPERQDRYLFTIPHTYVHYSIFIRNNSTVTQNWNDLIGKQVLIESGSVIEEIIQSQGLHVKLLYTSSFQEAMERLSNGTGDAVIMPKIQGHYFITEFKLYNLIESQTIGEALPYCIALPLGYEEMQNELNQSLIKLTNSYRIRNSQNKWFGIYSSNVSTIEKRSKFYKFILIFLIIGLVLISSQIYLFWKRIRQQKKYLKMQVAERNNYEKEFNLRHQLFVTGPIVFLKWSDTGRTMFDSISANFSIFGYNPLDLLKGRITYRNIIHPDDLDRVLQERQQHLDRKEFSYSQTYRIICPPTEKDDPSEEVVNAWHDRNYFLTDINTVQIKWIYEYTVILKDEVSKTNHFYGYILDITGQKNVESELLKQHQSAQVAINTKDIFLTSMSVEINSPLNALIGLCRKIKDSNLDEIQASSIETISTSALRLKQILQQIHDFLNILKGSIGSLSQWYVLKSLIEPMIAEFQIKIASKKIAFEYNEFQPTALVYLDADWFQKILRIVMDNAIKFTEEGKIELMVDVIRNKGAKDELIVKISDTGIGIAADKLQIIMEPFSQADETHTRRFGGIGLGLSIARNLLTQMNGVVSISSTPDVGTNVELRLPVKTR